MNKKLIPTILGGLGILGISSQALAYEVFTVNPNSIPGSSGFASFNADSITGVTSGRIVMDASTKTATETGYIQFGTFNLAGSSISGGYTGLDSAPSPTANNYGLYLTFDLAVTYDPTSIGAFGAQNSTYTIDSLTFTLFADPDLNTTFSIATVSADAGITDNGLEDIILGTGSLVIGTADLNNLGGVGINATTTFELTNPAGESFFIDPRPFYNFMFSGANNTSAGVIYNYNTGLGCTSGTCVAALQNSSITVDFEGVPEPATLALLGIGLLGFGTSRLRKTA